MKKLALILWFVWLVIGKSATISFSLSDFAANPLSIRTVRLTPVSQSQGSGTTVITGDSISYSTDTNGTFTVTNIVAGAYKVECVGGNTATTFYILAPTNTSTISASGLLTQPVATTGGQMAYAARASDLRYPSVAGTNIIIYTNGAGRIVINSSGSGGGSGSDTNYIGATNDLWFAVTNSLKSATNNSIVISTNGIFAPLTNFSIATTNGLHLVLTNFSIATTNGLDTALTAYSRATTNGLHSVLTNFTISATSDLAAATLSLVTSATNNVLVTATNFSISATGALAIAESVNRIIIDGANMSVATQSNTARLGSNGCTFVFRGPFTNHYPEPGSGQFNANSNLAAATFKFNSLTNFKIIGENAVFDIHNQRPGNLFEFRQCDNFTMSGFDIGWRVKVTNFFGSVANTNSTQTCTIAFYQSKNGTFERMKIRNPHNHAFNQLPNDTITTSSNFLFQDLNIWNAGCSNWAGLCQGGVTNPAFVDGAAIQIPPGSTVRRVNCYDCIRCFEIEGADTASATRDSQTEISIVDCNCYDVGEWAVGLLGTKGARIKVSNLMSTQTRAYNGFWGGSYGVYAGSTNTDLVINNCTFNKIGTGIFLLGGVSSGLRITGCAFTTNSNTGIIIWPSNGRGANGLNSTIIANNFFSQITGYGMDLAGLRYSTISGNTLWNTCINGSYKAPIYVRANDGTYSTTNVSSFLSIYGNSMFDTRGAGAVHSGIYLHTGVTNVQCFGNSIPPTFTFPVFDVDRANIADFDGTAAPSTVYTNGIGSIYRNRLTGKVYVSTNQTGGWYPIW